MSYTVGDVLLQAQNLLNDSTGQIYTTTVLLPFFQKAYTELQRKLQLNNIPVTKDRATAITFAASTVPQPFTPLPADLITPIRLFEKASGDADYLYMQMSERVWQPDIPVMDQITYWSWMNEVITLFACNTSRTVRLDYISDLSALTVVGDIVPVNNAQLYLASRTASLAAYCIGENESRAQALQQDAEIHLDVTARIGIKERQHVPTRRRAFSIYSRRWR